MTLELWQIVVLGIVLYLVMFALDRTIGDKIFRRGMTENERSFAASFDKAISRVTFLEEKIQELIKEIAGLKDTNDFLVGELKKSGTEMASIVARQLPVPPFPQAPPSTRALAQLPITPMLVICGDSEFCNDDMAQLSRARMWYRQLENASQRDVEEEIQRRRHDETLYPWALIPAHGNPGGIELSDGITPREWWQPQLEGFKVVMLSNCFSATTADVLAGLVDRVIVFYGERKSVDVSAFVYAFWVEMMDSNNPDQSYQKALQEVPQVRRWVDIRRR